MSRRRAQRAPPTSRCSPRVLHRRHGRQAVLARPLHFSTLQHTWRCPVLRAGGASGAADDNPGAAAGTQAGRHVLTQRGAAAGFPRPLAGAHGPHAAGRKGAGRHWRHPNHPERAACGVCEQLQGTHSVPASPLAWRRMAEMAAALLLVGCRAASRELMTPPWQLPLRMQDG